jgi:hypothetical protein
MAMESNEVTFAFLVIRREDSSALRCLRQGYQRLRIFGYDRFEGEFSLTPDC